MNPVPCTWSLRPPLFFSNPPFLKKFVIALNSEKYVKSNAIYVSCKHMMLWLIFTAFVVSYKAYGFSRSIMFPEPAITQICKCLTCTTASNINFSTLPIVIMWFMLPYWPLIQMGHVRNAFRTLSISTSGDQGGMTKIWMIVRLQKGGSSRHGFGWCPTRLGSMGMTRLRRSLMIACEQNGHRWGHVSVGGARSFWSFKRKCVVSWLFSNGNRDGG